MKKESEFEEYTEETISQAGWYFFHAKNPGRYDRPKFVEIEQDAIDEGWLKRPRYAGTYIGVIVPPELKK